MQGKPEKKNVCLSKKRALQKAVMHATINIVDKTTKKYACECWRIQQAGQIFKHN